MTAPDAGARRRGLRLLGGALALIGVFVVAAVAWVAVVAPQNPDIRLRAPEGSGLDASYWAPLLVTVVGGLALVALVFVAAARRLARGEDLYERRLGRRRED